jgi:hypothetical protein
VIAHIYLWYETKIITVPEADMAEGRRQKPEGFYVYYWYVVVWVVKFVLTFMATAILLFANREARE